ncbi:DUF3558 domain-containing protein [Nocardia sp. NPDC020380]|uniref:DUF3558 domain-containing protein n=1 Tax=Nocardia sp. NPDC020380 TaxID=3364309 RepID=UPI0037987B1B
MRRVWTGVALAAAAVATMATLTGCTQHSGDSAVRQSVDPNLLAGCGPIEDQKIAQIVGLTGLQQQSRPTICNWTGRNSAGAPVDVTYAWLQNDTMGREAEVAGQSGYQIERVVVKHFSGMYWHASGDPGSCAVTVADTGTVTWWVQNRDRSAQPDPCAAAMTLAEATLAVDGV